MTVKRKSGAAPKATSAVLIREAWDLSPDGLRVIDSSGIIIDVNTAFCRLVGKPREELVGQPFTVIYADAERDHSLETAIRNIHNGIVPETLTTQLTLWNQDRVWFEIRNTLIRRTGAPPHLLSIFSDITAQKHEEEARAKAERALHQSEERYRVVTESSRDFIFIINRDDTVDFVNKSGSYLLQKPLDQIIGRPRRELFPPDMADYQKRKLDEVFSSGQPLFEVTEGILDGRVVWQDTHLIPLHGSDGTVDKILGISRDVTAYKELEQQVRRSSAEIEHMFLAIPDLYFRLRTDGTILDFRAGKDVAPYVPPEQFLSRTVRQVLPPDVAEKITSALQVTNQTGQTTAVEYALSMPQGEAFYEARLHPLDVNEVIAFVRDITARTKAEAALKQSEFRFRNFAEHAPYAVGVSDLEGRVVFINRRFVETTGYTPDEIPTMEQWMRRAFPDETYRSSLMQTRKEDIISLLAGTKSVTPVHEYKVTCKSGKVKDMEISFSIAEGMIYTAFKDVTEQKRTEHALRKSDERVRELLASVTDYIYTVTLDNGHVASTVHGLGCISVTGYTPEEFADNPYLWYTMVFDEDKPAVQERTEAILKGRSPVPLEHRILRKNGSVGWVRSTIVLRYNDAGSLIGYDGLISDITERKKAEEQHAMDEARLEALVKLHMMQSATDKEIILHSMEEAVRLTRSAIGYIAFVNETESVLTLHAWSRAAMEQCRILDKPVDYPVEGTGLWGEALRQRRPIITNDYSAPNPLKRGLPDGHVGLTRHMNVPVFDGDHIVILAGAGNKPTEYDDSDVRQLTLLMTGLWQILKRRRAEKALRERDFWLNESQRIGRIGSYEMNLSTNLWTSSETLDAIFGIERTREKSLDLWAALVHPDEREAMVHYFTEYVVAGKNRFDKEYRIIRPSDGAERWLWGKGELQFDATGAPMTMMGTIMDITERKQVEQELGLFFNVTLDMLCIADFRGYFQRLSPTWTKALGWSEEELKSKPFIEFVHPDDRAATLTATRGLIEGREIIGFDNRYRCRDGSFRWLSWNSFAIMDRRLVIAAARDITDRKLAEEAIRESERKFRAIIEQNSEGVVLVNEDGSISEWNAAQEAISGWKRADVIGKYFADVLYMMARPERRSPENLDRYTRIVRQALATGASEMFGRPIEAILQRPDGAHVPIQQTIFPIKTEQGIRIGAVTRDISAQKQAEEALRQAQKMESIGILAGGIAHDFNNLLNAILGQTSLARTKLPPENPARNNLEKAEQAAEKAADLTQQLLAYSGRGKFNIQPIGLGRLISENMHLFEVAIPKNVRLRAETTDALPPVTADAGQMQQVIMNLIINGAEAIGERPGTVRVRTSTVDIGTEDVRVWSMSGLAVSPGLYVLIEVSDDGCGMDEETRRKMFDPFFSTKIKGRGLGLAAVQGIVRGHKGAMQVHSVPGEGTTFRLIFPGAEGEEKDTVADPRTTGSTGGKKRVLVIDDETFILDVVRDVLDHAGHTVLTAVGGREGVEMYRTHRAEIDVVLLDLSMPVMNGDEVFHAIKLIDADAKIVLSSGYAEEEATQKFAGEHLAGFIQKPYRPDTLLKVLEKL